MLYANLAALVFAGLLLYWMALASDHGWRVLVSFNEYGEAWPEIVGLAVTFAASVGAVAVTVLELARRGRE